MTRVIYTAKANVTGGRLNGRGRTSDGSLDVELRPPVELGGEGGAPNPEQLFAVGWAACLEATLHVAAQRRRLPLERVADASIDVRVKLLVPKGAREFDLGAEFDVTLPSVGDRELAAELVHGAHALCPYSRATHSNIEAVFTVNGAPFPEADDAAGSLA
jgi:lipoyl-dependent peroxiredoxin